MSTKTLPPAPVALGLTLTPARMYGPDSIEARRARQLHQAAKFKDRLAKAAAEAPPLTTEQVREIRSLLRSFAAQLTPNADVDGAA